MSRPPARDSLLVHLAAGIGDVVLATPLLALFARAGFLLDVRVDGDYVETADLLRNWGALRDVTVGTNPPLDSFHAVLPAVPPFYWARYEPLYRHATNAITRPPDAAFHRDARRWYLDFAKPLLRTDETPFCALPVAADPPPGICGDTLVLAPGCKGGEMAAKRWPHFPTLAESFADVAVVGTPEDLTRCGRFPPHVKNLVGRLSLRATAAAIAAAGAVVANDSGLGHIAAAVGVPTVLLFGPTSADVLGQFPPNVTVLRATFPCAPCWSGARFAACGGSIACMAALSPTTVAAALRLFPSWNART